jgi:hypothetical protein
MSDARSELHQRSLTNVRALLDKEQEEFARQKRARRLLVWVAVPTILLVAGVVWYAARNNPASRDAAEKRRVACVSEVWAARSRDAEVAIRAANPGMPPSEIGLKLQADSAKFQAEANAECKRIMGR